MFVPENRQYTIWELKGDSCQNSEELDICPIKEKMLVGDNITDDRNILKNSPYRTNDDIPGILIYNSKSYGRCKNKLLYKCIPNDRKLPEFIAPYKCKNEQFTKCKMNKYILFKVGNWKNKHPEAIITRVLGDIDEENVFYEYQLYCKNLQHSIKKFTNATKRSLAVHENININIDRGSDIIAIDPEGSVDFDDALGYHEITSKTNIVSVYIANVPYWLEALDLWEHFSNRITTVYLPDNKRTMLPTKLSDDVCSLKANLLKHVTSMDVRITEGNIESIEFSNVTIIVSKNFVYEEPDLLNDPTYTSLKRLGNEMNINTKYLDNIKDSHDVVAYFMIMMNHEAGKLLNRQNVGIYRSVTCNIGNLDVPPEVREYMNVWTNAVGKYESYSEQKGHALIGEGLEAYVHITSPIRRIVDLINLLLLHKSLNTISVKAEKFVEYWVSNIDHINITFANVKKVQNDCTLLNNCLNPQLENVIGFIIEVNECENGFKYRVYIPLLTLTTVVYSTINHQIYSKHNFTKYVFVEEVTLNRKIRLEFK